MADAFLPCCSTALPLVSLILTHLASEIRRLLGKRMGNEYVSGGWARMQTCGKRAYSWWKLALLCHPMFFFLATFDPANMIYILVGFGSKSWRWYSGI